jgi:hypothetical protein
MLKRITTLAAAVTAIALAAAPAEAEAQAPSDVLSGVVQNLPHTPALPPELSPNLDTSQLPGLPSISPSPNIPQLDEIPIVPWHALPR